MAAHTFAVPDWNDLADAREQSLAAGERLAEDAADAAADCCCGSADEVAKLTVKLAKVHMLLKAIRRVTPRPARAESADDEPLELAVIGHAAAIATIHARIDLYLGRS
jgi:hypothetical protein